MVYCGRYFFFEYCKLYQIFFKARELLQCIQATNCFKTIRQNERLNGGRSPIGGFCCSVDETDYFIKEPTQLSTW